MLQNTTKLKRYVSAILITGWLFATPLAFAQTATSSPFDSTATSTTDSVNETLFEGFVVFFIAAGGVIWFFVTTLKHK